MVVAGWVLDHRRHKRRRTPPLPSLLLDTATHPPHPPAPHVLRHSPAGAPQPLPQQLPGLARHARVEQRRLGAFLIRVKAVSQGLPDHARPAPAPQGCGELGRGERQQRLAVPVCLAGVGGGDGGWGRAWHRLW